MTARIVFIFVVNLKLLIMKSILEFCQIETPTKEQISALTSMEQFVDENNKEDFHILSGAAGTGKTTITTTLINYLNQKEIIYKICAPTGRAARILGRKSKTENSTIHSMIYSISTNPDNGFQICDLKQNDISEYQIYIIDEASMISSINHIGNQFQTKDALLVELLQFIKDGNPLNKVIFIGDQNQLTPVNEKQSRALDISYLIERFTFQGKKSILTEVKRQKENSIVLENANRIRVAIDNKSSNFITHGIETLNYSRSIKDYLTLLEKDNNDNVISIACSAKMNFNFNQRIRANRFLDSQNTIAIGDVLLVTQTWKRNGHKLFSGDHVKVIDFDLNDKIHRANLVFLPVKLEYKNIKNEKMIVLF